MSAKRGVVDEFDRLMKNAEKEHVDEEEDKVITSLLDHMIKHKDDFRSVLTSRPLEQDTVVDTFLLLLKRAPLFEEVGVPKKQISTFVDNLFENGEASDGKGTPTAS